MDERQHAALASPTRRRVLDALRDSPEPLDARAVADALGLHVTTARFHLDHLADAGMARRGSASEGRRGRPRVLFSPAGPLRDEDARDRLINALAPAVDRDAALRAGHRWADEIAAPEAEDPAPGLIAVLDRLGFAPEAEPGADAIRLTACPFRAAAREHPDVVCTVHRGLLEGLLEGTGTEPRLTPFAEPELCLVTLHA